jgi:predicted dinucleotide-binding enzyme
VRLILNFNMRPVLFPIISLLIVRATVARGDEAIQEADIVLLTIPNTFGVDCNVHILSSGLEHVTPGHSWR